MQWSRQGACLCKELVEFLGSSYGTIEDCFREAAVVISSLTGGYSEPRRKELELYDYLTNLSVVRLRCLAFEIHLSGDEKRESQVFSYLFLCCYSTAKVERLSK